jgi:Putative Ig domain
MLGSRMSIAVLVTAALALLGTAPAASAALVIDDRPLPSGNVGTDYASFVTATGGNGTPYRWSIVSGSLPSGLRLSDFASSSGLISGRPTTVQTRTFTVRVRDQAGNSATRQFTIKINAPRPLVITSPSQLPAGTRGKSYAVGVFADGGTTPYKWTRTSGSLPPGLSLQSSPGRISGTPTTTGTYNFTLRVSDARGQTAGGAFSITINAPIPPPTAPAAPTLVSPASGASVVTPLTISWAAPAGAVSAYNWQVSARSDFATMAAVGSTAGTVTQATVSDIANGTYFWRVQAVNGTAVGPYSAARSFTVTGTTSPPALTGVGVSPGEVKGGTSSTGTVFISLPAPAAGTTVALTNSNPAVASVPASVTVPAGAMKATFTVATQPVTSSFTAVITASLDGNSRFAFLSVVP